MDNKIDFVKNKVKKHGKKFSLFIIIGIFKTILIIALSWLFIDVLSIKALIGSTISVFFVFFITYFAYVITKVMKPRFITYMSTTTGFNIIAILLIWFFVDFVKLSGASSSTIVSGALFLIRYLFFNKMGLIYHG